MNEKLKANVIGSWTSLERLAEEITDGAGISSHVIVDFFELIDMHMADSVFTDMVRERFKDL